MFILAKALKILKTIDENQILIINKKRKPFHITFKKPKTSTQIEIEKKELKLNFGLGRGILGKKIISLFSQLC